MKSTIRLSLIYLLCVTPFYVMAQPQPPRQGPQGDDMHMTSPKEQAKMMADIMKRDVNLDNKKYKAVYKLFAKDFKFIQKIRSQSFQGGMAPHGGGGQGMGGAGISYSGENGEMGISANSRGANMSGSVNLGQGASMNGSVGVGSGGVGLRGGFTIGGHGGGSSMGSPGGGGPGGGSPGGGGPGGGNPGGGGPGGGMHSQNGMGPDQMPFPEKYLKKEDNKLKKILSPEQYRMWREKHPFDYLTFMFKPEKDKKIRDHRRF